MPYIKQEDRQRIKPHVEEFLKKCPVFSEGELNYIITSLLESYRHNEQKYSTFNKIIGILECVKLEYYRRMIWVYEDTKMQENGDVYHF